ncbi:DNA-binding transcriptional regulator, LysR family [Cohaesibacter sp. ES.047]|uniref:LysR family transcriptional regulator n=1 Tax=Cohaesibacter sp. ES.047 TaxID=1798205 RepID=UPI000BB7EB80|nr:LysR family transcriptional regulator [Cohaesibacter sp. ES.047]SNY90196.1 DNA-binding transcriptional regulator, LysR family [Cohaesibacter sp. ES.047]
MNSLSQRALEAFSAVMLTGSVSAAAEELRVSQPAVSRLIRDLENDLNIPLFTRHGSRVIATPEAYELIKEVERSFVGLRQIAEAAEEIRSGNRSTLRIAAAPAFAQTVLCTVISELLLQRPEFRVDSLSMTTLNVVRQVAMRQCQVGFGIPTEHKHEVDVVMTGDVPFRFIAPADHPYGEKLIVTLDDLADIDFVAFDESTITGRIFNRLFARMRRPPSIKTRSYLSQIVSALVIRGVGAGIVDGFTAEDHQRMGGIVRPITIESRFGYSVIKPRGDQLSHNCQALIDHFDMHAARLNLN